MQKNLKKFLLIMAGFLVLIMPLAFFADLADDMAERKRDTAINLLIEELNNHAAQLRENLKPENYVRSTIIDAEKEFLRGLEPELANLYPGSDFGDEYFNDELAEKIYQTMGNRGLKPFLVQVTSNAFSQNFYRLADEIIEFCGDELEFFLTTIAKNLYMGLRTKYYRLYQKEWRLPDQKNQGKFQASVLFEKISDKFIEKYLSRFEKLEASHDQVTQIFTDYYGKQTLYAYAKGFFSPASIHGAYMVIVRREDIDPKLIIEDCFNNVEDNFDAQLVAQPDFDSEIIIEANQIVAWQRLPTELLSHISFRLRQGLSAPSLTTNSHAVRISMQLPGEISRTRLLANLAEWSVWLVLPVYLLLVLYLQCYGLTLSLNIKTKLAVIFAGIVLIPVAGTSLLIWSMSLGEPRMIEKQTRQLTENKVNIFRQHILELNLRYILAAAHIKQAAEQIGGYDHNFWQFISQLPAAEALTDYFKHYYCVDNAAWFSHMRISRMQKLPAKPSKLIQAITGKFLGNLGVLNFSDNAVIKMQNDNMASLAMLESIVTPELEEAHAVNEGTVEKDLTMAPDTIRALPLVISHAAGNYSFIMLSDLRSNDGVLFDMANDMPNTGELFASLGEYADVTVGARLRTSKTLKPHIWPVHLSYDGRINDGMELAMNLRDSGTKAFRLDEGKFEVVSWFYEVYEPTVIAARGESRAVRPATSAGVALQTAVPGIFFYAVLVLYVISALSTEFMVKPIKVIEKGIKRINEQHYGTLISGFSNDEFSDVAEAFNEMSLGLKQREIIRRHVSEKLFEQVQAGKHKSEKIEVTVLASDIRGFTAITEKYSPAQVIEMLNSYFTAMEQAIKKHGGVIDKYIGDAIQAVFYQDDASAVTAVRACRAAVAMRESLHDLNVNRRAQGLFTIENGVGLATGEVISGSIGSDIGRKDYSITGKSTEIAAKLESMTVDVSSRILICQATYDMVKDSCTTAAYNDEGRELKNV